METPTRSLSVPPRPTQCSICASDHEVDLPHNLTSFYQARFHLTHDRATTSADACAHCEDKVRRQYQEELEKVSQWTEPDGSEPIAEKSFAKKPKPPFQSRERKQKFEDEYLGGGIYASFNGYQVELGLRIEDDDIRIRLDPHAFKKLQRFARNCFKERKADG